MANATAGLFDAIKATGPTRADSIARVTMLAHFLDNAIPIPGTRRRIGFDALIGLVPGVGDAVSAILSSYIVWEAHQLGLSRWKIARMMANVAVDTVVGAVPLVGDVFDATFKANARNLRIITSHLEKTGRMTPKVIDGEAVRLDG